MRKIILVLLWALAGLNFSFAQSDVADLLKFGTNDANKLIEAYVNPYAKTLGVGLNNSWYNTAETHKLWGFDLAFTVSAVKISGSDKTFDVNALGLTNSRVSSGSSLAPTAAGDGEGIDLDIYNNDGSSYVSTLRTPGGYGADFIPIPMMQASFGLMPHTDVIGRWVPIVRYNIEDDRGKVGLWGLGMKHNFKESLPFIRHLPFDASVFLGYSKISAETGVSFGYSNFNVATPDGYVQDENQKGDTKTSTFKYGVIVSKKLSVITFYASASGNKSKSTFDLLGRYPVGADDDGTINYADIPDPINIDIKNSYFAVDAGFRLKLAFFSLFASVAKADYMSYNAGLSFGLR